jgi:hypothetical protein
LKPRSINRRAFLARTSVSLAAAAGGKVSGQSPSQHKLTVGDDRLRILLECGSDGLRETAYLVNGEPIAGLRAVTPWSLELDEGTVTPAGLPCELRRTDGNPLAVAASFEGRWRANRWQLEYRVTGPGRITKSLRILYEGAARLLEAAFWGETTLNLC